MLAFNARSIATEAIGRFGSDWALWSRSPLAMGVAPLILLWIGLTFVERKFPAGSLKPVSNWLLNLKISLVSLVVTPFKGVLLGIFLGYISSRIGFGLIDLRLQHDADPGKEVMAFLIWFFAIDFFFYWYHRFEHESLLWQQHKVHHMDEQVSAVTAYRVHWLESLFHSAVVLVPTTLLFKFDLAAGGIALGVISVLSGLWETLYHANLKIGFGWASVLLVSPQFHRIHHSRLPEHHDKNFAGYFPILDVIFGTYYHPRPNEYPPTGVPDEKEVESFAHSLVLPLHEWWRMFCSWRQRRTEVVTSPDVSTELNLPSLKHSPTALSQE